MALSEAASPLFCFATQDVQISYWRSNHAIKTDKCLPLSKTFRFSPHHLTMTQRHLWILWSVSWCPPSPGQESNQTVLFEHSSQVRCCPMLEVRREVDRDMVGGMEEWWKEKVVLEGERRDRCTNVHLHTVNMPENFCSKTCLYYHTVHIKGLHSEFVHKPWWRSLVPHDWARFPPPGSLWSLQMRRAACHSQTDLQTKAHSVHELCRTINVCLLQL